MAMPINALEFLYNIKISYPCSFNLHFDSISQYIINKNNINLGNLNSHDKDTFNQYLRHPLIKWKLEVSVDNFNFVTDLITNITNAPMKGYRVGGVNYVDNPCMVLKHDLFLQKFNIVSSNTYPLAIENIDSYKQLLKFKLNGNTLNSNVFSASIDNFGILNILKHYKL